MRLKLFVGGSVAALLGSVSCSTFCLSSRFNSNLFSRSKSFFGLSKTTEDTELTKPSRDRAKKQKTSLIIGTGIVGLTSAFYLAKSGHRVICVERREDVALETRSNNDQTEFLFDMSNDFSHFSVSRTDRWFVRLCWRLGRTATFQNNSFDRFSTDHLLWNRPRSGRRIISLSISTDGSTIS